MPLAISNVGPLPPVDWLADPVDASVLGPVSRKTRHRRHNRYFRLTALRPLRRQPRLILSTGCHTPICRGRSYSPLPDDLLTRPAPSPSLQRDMLGRQEFKVEN